MSWGEGSAFFLDNFYYVFRIMKSTYAILLGYRRKEAENF